MLMIGAGLYASGMMIFPFRRANVASTFRVRTGGTDAIRLGCTDAHDREVSLVEKEQGRIVETATEARQAEFGPSILLVLLVSVGSAAAMLGAVWFVLFRTYRPPSAISPPNFSEINNALNYAILQQSSFAGRR